MLLSGVIEGFYGAPWTPGERLTLFDRMNAWNLDTYVYAPKDDLHHRAVWRERYGDADAEVLAQLIQACRQRDIRFVYGIGPGLDIRYGDTNEQARLRDRLSQLLALGCDHFALLFDDIPDRLDAEEIARWGSLAAAQSDVANSLFAWTRQQRPEGFFGFCPTPYCGRMADAHLGGAGYLDTLGATLHPDIDVFWTGPEIISREISIPHVRDVAARLRRKPVIWDNLHANDYDGQRMLLGPYAGRPPDLRHEVRGILSNPNTEFPLNYIALRTLAAFVNADGPWNPREAYLAAMEEWRPSFESISGPLDLDDLVLLGDCFYLPYDDGPRAHALIALARRALARGAPSWREDAEAFRAEATRLRDCCGRLAYLRQRPLFHALSRRIWDLREELDLLVRYVDATLSGDLPNRSFHSDFHLPGTFRGGVVARLQRLLTPRADGTFINTRASEPDARRHRDE